MHCVEQNPVRAKMVRKPSRYPWSGAAVHVEARKDDGLLDLERWREAYGDEARWRGVLERGMDGDFAARQAGTPEEGNVGWWEQEIDACLEISTPTNRIAVTWRYPHNAQFGGGAISRFHRSWVRRSPMMDCPYFCSLRMKCGP